ncbi:hypothetical protein O7621_08300 [Solwaraspora sp. WMMD937]|uniref:hypothetical protein n=1 Tax=Solwaraspora sp. WMMD937 TaxID=3016090 RepID=UPI00249B0142|nr:hypothetical protein [Solwaraspora sp. WMMD937]WFE23289.1 hypothetical protein O7621_08300 [Solwaraspora sp. WMMD937]
MTATVGALQSEIRTSSEDPRNQCTPSKWQGERQSRKMRLIRNRAAILSVLTGFLLMGCGTTATDGASRNASNGQQSFDLFLGDKVGVIDYALNLLRNRCLADSGYPQNLQGMAAGPTTSFPYLKISAKSFGPTSEDEARRLGFGLDAPAQPGRVVSFDPSYDRVLERCQKEAYDSLDSNTKKILNSYKDLGNVLMTEFSVAMDRFIENEMPDASTGLLRCLKNKGYRPDDEVAFLANPDHRGFGVKFGDVEGGEDNWEPKRVKGTVQLGPPIPAKRYIPTPQESKLAVAWFQCRRDIGLTPRLIAFSNTAQAKIVAQHEARLVELNTDIERIARDAAQFANR